MKKISAITKFRFYLFAMLLIANVVLYCAGVKDSWAIFFSNIMMFTMEGDLKKRFITAEIGGLTGLVLALLMCLAIAVLTPVAGSVVGFGLPLGIVLFLLIMLQPVQPIVFNNVGFAYLTAACIDSTAFCGSFLRILITFLVGSLLINGAAIGLFKVCFRKPLQ